MGGSRLRIFFTRTSNLTSMTFLWTLFYWKVCLGCASEQKKKNALDIVIFMHFTAIGANFFSPPCSSLLLPFPGPSSSRVTHQNTSTRTLWHQRSCCVTSVRQELLWKVTAALMLQQSVRPAPRSILQRIGTGEIRASSAPQYVSIQVFSNSVFILKGCTDTGEPKVWDSFPTYV